MSISVIKRTSDALRRSFLVPLDPKLRTPVRATGVQAYVARPSPHHDRAAVAAGWSVGLGEEGGLGSRGVGVALGEHDHGAAVAGSQGESRGGGEVLDEFLVVLVEGDDVGGGGFGARGGFPLPPT